MREMVFLLDLLSQRPFPNNAIWTPEVRQAAVGLIWIDLLGRLKEEQPNMQGGIVERLRRLVADFTDGGDDAKIIQGGLVSMQSVQSGAPYLKQVDVLVLCPLAKEFNPSLVAYGIDPFEREDINLEGHKVFFVNVPRVAARSLSLAVSVVNKPRNVPCAIATYKLVAATRPQAVFLSGIGGGIRGKVDLGDVIISKSVIDIMGGRSEPDGVRRRDDPIVPPNPIARQLDYFTVPIDEWREVIRKIVGELRTVKRFALPDDVEVSKMPLKVESGIVVAGERLVADGTLPNHIVDRDDRIRTCDMEGSGFGYACEDLRKQWLVFRGIADFGDPDKTDKWQAVAACSAALAVRQFLQTEFRLPDEVATLF